MGAIDQKNGGAKDKGAAGNELRLPDFWPLSLALELLPTVVGYQRARMTAMPATGAALRA